MKSTSIKEKNGKTSTQRINLIGALVGSLYLITTVGVYILKRAGTTEGVGESEWIGMSMLVFGLLTGLGLNAGVKAWQKKHEKE